MIVAPPPMHFIVYVRLTPQLPYWPMQSAATIAKAEQAAADWLAVSGPHAQVAIQPVIEIQRNSA